MHEAATARSLSGAVLREAEKRSAARVLRVEVEIGELSFLEPEQLSFWVSQDFQGTVAEGAELCIKPVESVVTCQECGYSGGLQVKEDPAYHLLLPSFQCPRCSSPRLVVERGRECVLRRIELELPDSS